MAQVMTPGWYPDPWRQAPMRWWDGFRWTPQVSGPVEDPADKLREQRSWARWHLIGLRVAPVLLLGSGLLVSLLLHSVFTEVRDSTDTGSSFEPPPGFFALQALSALLSPLSLSLLIARLGWFAHAVRTARALGRRSGRSTGLAVAGWLIPIVNLWWPYEDVRDLTPEGDPARRRLGWWWGCYLLQGFGLFPAVVVAFFDVPTVLLVLTVVVGVVPAVAAAWLETGIVRGVLDSHERGQHQLQATLER